MFLHNMDNHGKITAKSQVVQYYHQVCIHQTGDSLHW